MRKNLLALSIAAMVGGLSGVANAQAVGTDTIGGRVIANNAPYGKLVAPGTPGSATMAAAATTLSNSTTGVGHILFVPYFTTQQGNMTLLNLVNTDTVNGKAVKLRFRGAANSDDLFDITIYLSPGDVWAANVSANGDLSALSTEDSTCTVPSIAQIKESSGKFLTGRVMNNDARETREGYVEILNMADVPPGSALFTATKHATAADGTWKAPCTPAVMDLQSNPLVANDPTHDPVVRGYSWPTGGLSANWTIVNVGTKASFSGEAVALRATPTVLGVNQQGAANLVFSPQTTVRVPNAAALTADPLLQIVNGPVRAASYDFPDLSTPYTTGVGALTPEAQATELAMALETFSINNEYITTPAVSFSTDWVFSMPTRRYAVAMDYANKKMVFNAGVNRNFTAANSTVNAAGRICVDAGQLVAYDREEHSRTSFVISPNEADVLTFCGETSVLSFNGKASVLGASLTPNNIPTKFADGWLSVKTTGLGNGLPILGYAVGKAIGPDGGNFGGIWLHRTNRFNNQPF